jgi:hypothetical protein
MRNQSGDKVLFNVLPWANTITVQGNKAFFKAIAELIGRGEKYRQLVDDITDCLVSVNDFYEGDNHVSVVKFQDLIQLNFTKSAAFDISEILQARLPHEDAEKIPVNVIFAFTKTLQAAVLNIRIPSPNDARHDKFNWRS